MNFPIDVVNRLIDFLHLRYVQFDHYKTAVGWAISEVAMSARYPNFVVFLAFVATVRYWVSV